MFFDARAFPEQEVIEADLCIIGGGAAGITLAHEMIGSSARVVLLESGDRFFDDRIQSLYDGPNIGIQGWPLDEARLRMLGGSTNHWAGNCMPLDPIDFEERPGVPYSGWPITRQDLDPYYLRAQRYTETPADELYDTVPRLEQMGLPPLPFDNRRLKTFLFSESPPTLFGMVYEEPLAKADNVGVYLHATALDILTNDTASDVSEIRASSIEGPEFRVRARQYVLATGGVEVPRLLLLSDSVAKKGLGNDNDLVGRFFMDHLSIRPSLTALLQGKEADFGLYTQSHLIDGGYFRAAVGAADTLLLEEELPNFRFILFENKNRSPGQQSTQTLKRSLERGKLPPNLLGHMENLLTDMDGVTNEAYRTVTGAKDSLIQRTWLDPWISVESIPNPDSRVELVSARDEYFGQRKVSLDWQLTEADLRANVRATEILAMELGRLGYGRVWSELLQDGTRWPGHPHHGKHHTGTARMASDPKRGVVDADCRVHGVSNLFVAGSAVFPTQGHATPTLTIVALSVRLADHIKTRLAKGSL